MNENKTENLLEQPESKMSSSLRRYNLPEKFYDAGTGEIKVEELAAAYNELAARDSNLVEGNVRTIPSSYD